MTFSALLTSNSQSYNPLQFYLHIYRRAPTNPARPIITLPAPTTKSFLAALPDCVAEAPVAVPLDVLATLTAPLSVVCAEVPPVPVAVVAVVAADTAREMALDVVDV